MNTQSGKAIRVLLQPAFLLLFVAIVFAAIVPAMAEGNGRAESRPVSRSGVVEQKAARKKATLARHHLTMPFFSFTPGG